MAIVQDRLYKKTLEILNKFRYRFFKENDGTIKKWNGQFDFGLIYYLLKEIIYNKPVDNHTQRGKITDWNGLPPSKSLFHSAQGCGLPIGNLTSQLFSNIYLNDFDLYVKCQLKCKYYGRYVDDFVIVHPDKYYLKSVIPKISVYLKENLQLELHPNKIYLQPAEKGVQFLGANIKPYRTYMKNRTKGNFYKALTLWNSIIENKPGNKLTKTELQQFVSCINSYLGFARQHNTYKLRKQMILHHMAKPFWNYVYLCNNEKLVVKKKYKMGII
jgi:RNA-directed DNA polymerase